MNRRVNLKVTLVEVTASPPPSCREDEELNDFTRRKSSAQHHTGSLLFIESSAVRCLLALLYRGKLTQSSQNLQGDRVIRDIFLVS
jgi:hypothetical protein